MKLKSINYSAKGQKHSPQRGQYYLHKKDLEVYVVSNAEDGEWALICLNEGCRWNEWQSNINDIFDGDDEDFELIQPGTELTFTV